MTEAQTQTDGFKWYTLRVLGSRELKVKEAIERECEEGTLKGIVKQVLVPTKTVLHVKNGKKISRIRRLFPGYVFLCAKLYSEAGELSRDVVVPVRRIQGVAGFMGGNDSPAAMSASEAGMLLSRAEEGQGKTVLKTDYEVGGRVKITDGAFLGSSAVIDEVDVEKGRLRVSVSIFGRFAPLDLEYRQVQKED